MTFKSLCIYGEWPHILSSEPSPLCPYLWTGKSEASSTFCLQYVLIHACPLFNTTFPGFKVNFFFYLALFIHDGLLKTVWLQREKLYLQTLSLHRLYCYVFSFLIISNPTKSWYKLERVTFCLFYILFLVNFYWLCTCTIVQYTTCRCTECFKWWTQRNTFNSTEKWSLSKSLCISYHLFSMKHRVKHVNVKYRYCNAV